MKIATLSVIVLAAGNLAMGSEGSAFRYRVMVCSSNEPGSAPANAHQLTTRMFADIGIEVMWLPTTHCPAGALQIALQIRTPFGLLPGALGYAMPCEGKHIVIFLDRVRAQTSGHYSMLLAHVMAHEITHVLQGFGRHSSTGLMKAHWDSDDLFAVVVGTLPFTPEDRELIYQGLERRQGVPEQCHNDGTAEGIR